LQLLAELFETHDAPVENLQAFISGNAQKIYNITPLEKTVTLEQKPYQVPATYNGVVPMYANEEINYTIKEIQYGD